MMPSAPKLQRAASNTSVFSVGEQNKMLPSAVIKVKSTIYKHYTNENTIASFSLNITNHGR